MTVGRLDNDALCTIYETMMYAAALASLAMAIGFSMAGDSWSVVSSLVLMAVAVYLARHHHLRDID